MKVKKSLGILVMILFSSQMLLIFTSDNQTSPVTAFPLQLSDPFEGVVIQPPAPPGVENVKSNIMQNGGFEEDDYRDGPEHFGYWGDSYEICNASYQDDVHGGSYGLYIAAKGTDQISNNVYCSRSLITILERAYLVEDISLDLWFKVKANPDITEGAYGYSYVRVNTGGTNYYIRYMFTADSVPGNQSTTGYYDVRQPVGSWAHLQRNVTQDFEEVFPSVPITPSFYVDRVYFRAYTIINPTGFIEILADDVSITNGTAFNYLSANGDFEDGFGTNWPNYKDGPTSVKLSDDDFTEGTSSLNITAHAFFDGAYSYTECGEDAIDSWDVYPDGFYPTEPGAVVMDFDWKYTESSSGGTSQDAYFYMSMFNETFTAYLYFFLGDVSDIVSNVNATYATSIYRYYEAPGFGNRDTWEHFSLDLYEFCQLENLQNLIPDYFYWRINCGDNPDSFVTLLVDDFSFVADPLGDPSFEQDAYWHPSDPLNSWGSLNHNFVNRTTDAHTGSYAANVSAHSMSGSTYAYRNLYLPVDANLYTDFWWRLDELSGIETAYTFLYLELDSSKFITYVLGLNDNTYLINSSDAVYYTVEGQNQTGTWTNIFRNVQEDAFVAFGEANWNITFIYLGAYATGTSVVKTLFDDLYFVRDIAHPVITNLQQNPLIPQYDEMVTIEVDVTDNLGVDTVELFYKIGSSGWQSTAMGSAGDHYTGLIPIALWDSLVQYYILAIDIHGLETYLDNGGPYYDYTSIDTIDPILVVEAPPISEVIVGDVRFNITGFDAGSGSAIFDVKIDGITVLTDTVVPSDYIWQTTYPDNGNHTLTFTLTDNAGNFAEESYEYLVDNPAPSTSPEGFLQKWWPYLAAGGGGLVVGILAIIIVIRVRKRRIVA